MLLKSGAAYCLLLETNYELSSFACQTYFAKYFRINLMMILVLRCEYISHSIVVTFNSEGMQ